MLAVVCEGNPRLSEVFLADFARVVGVDAMDAIIQLVRRTNRYDVTAGGARQLRRAPIAQYRVLDAYTVSNPRTQNAAQAQHGLPERPARDVVEEEVEREVHVVDVLKELLDQQRHV